MDTFQPRYPLKRGGNPIRFFRVVRVNEVCAIAKITDYEKKQGEVIAVCKIYQDYAGAYSFKILPSDAGHYDLCRLLRDNGIKGTYREWLYAKEAGHDQLAEEKSRFAEIGFECDLIDEAEASGWTIL